MAWGSQLAIPFFDSTTGEPDTSSYAVKLQPMDQAFDTGSIALAQKTVDTHVWGLTSDSLDDDTHYAIYIDGSDSGLRVFAPNSYPALGE